MVALVEELLRALDVGVLLHGFFQSLLEVLRGDARVLVSWSLFAIADPRSFIFGSRVPSFIRFQSAFLGVRRGCKLLQGEGSTLGAAHRRKVWVNTATLVRKTL